MTGKVFLCFKMSFATNFGRQDGWFSFYIRTRYVPYFSGPTCRVNPKPTEFSWQIACFFTVWTWAFLQSSRIRSRARCFRSIMCTGIASGVSLWWSDGGCQSPSVSKKMALEDRGFYFFNTTYSRAMWFKRLYLCVFLLMIYGMLSAKPIGKFPKNQWREWLDSKNRCKRRCYNNIVVRSREGWSNGGKDVCEMFTTSTKSSQYPTNLWIILSLDIPHTKCCQNVGVVVYIRFQGSACKPLTPQAMIRCLQGRRQDQWMCSSSTTNLEISQITG